MPKDVPPDPSTSVSSRTQASLFAAVLACMTAIKKRTRAERHLTVARAIIATVVAFRVVEDKHFPAIFDDENDVPSRFGSLAS